MIIEHLPDGFVRLTPDDGKRLYNIASEQYYSEAVVKESKVAQFMEVDV